ncbi:hypothetical protein SLEP1_g5760 [Rubroshorea leprosula]|uniref:Uncharacterized protein n=1 Tax=Rubroshorea leprosula TaxID=152421 RepID=A0AAV5I1U0_9ROSI|nr:hypothetical protein SLEP1_g5760 [Rubroshorea leprosula]
MSVPSPTEEVGDNFALTSLKKKKKFNKHQLLFEKSHSYRFCCFLLVN